ncbi:hypothetical protein COV24_02075 [candidate division WWE3 bacterium CG10_big_fil_rev_8_21_14_0_10_32_10]|uniref:O-antigen ligase-related domain-containing protein n=1 Tax=candidate division WWE3 bacterium CG10_big_fil_rev_8_21_14_0_10_32_10 TaxID=1975090 RepID=A0A2H0RAV5_UNCKA|nr:MAG: hypothetical protein COV24_02075 [candidate division WWE3 bacterium CG10_big_fil_rev_8_21_14_0_10_32_10]
MIKINAMLKNAGIFLLSLLSFLMVLNHKELFSIYQWNILPVRIVSALLILYGLLLLFIYKKKLVDAVFFSLFGLFVVIFCSSFVSSDLLDSLLYALFYLFVAFLYLSIKFLYKNIKNFKELFIDLYLISVSVSLAVVVFQIIFFYSTSKLVGAVWPVPNHVPRFGAFFWDINHFGLFLAFGFWLCVYKVFIFAKNKVHLLKYSCLLFLILISLFLTSSRSALLGLGFGTLVFTFLFLYYFTSVLKKHFYMFIKYLVIFLPVFIFSVSVFAGTFIRNFFFYRIHSFFTHFILLKIGFYMFLKHPLLGVGGNDFGTALKDSSFFKDFALLDPGALSYKVPIHSVWFQFLTESGILAFIFFAFFSIFTLFLLFKSYTKTKKILFLILFSAFFGALVSGIFYSYNLEFFWLFLLFSAVVGYNNFSFSKKFFFKFIKMLYGFKFLMYLGIFVYLLYLLSKIDNSPSYSEILLFNSAKSGVGDGLLSGFYTMYLNKFQYMFGYFPYVGRLLSFTFAVPVVYLSYLILQKLKFTKKLIFTTSYVLLLGYTSSFFEINKISFYFYLGFLASFSIIFFVDTSKLRYVNSKIYTNFIHILLFVSLVMGFFILSPSKINIYQPNVSRLVNTLAQKYSLGDFKIYTDISGADDTVSFYTEPKTSVYLVDQKTSIDANINYIFLSRNKNLNIPYSLVVTGNNVYGFINFERSE